MTTRILPQEFLFQEGLTPIQVQTVASKEILDDPKQYLLHIRHFKLAVGTVILVQVLDETKDMLLHEAEFRVIAAVETQIGIQDDYGSRVRPQTQYQIERKSEWWSSSLAPVEAEPEPERVPETYVPGEGSLKWHPGKKVWEVIVGGNVWATIERREGEEKEDYKARALAIAAGSAPLPRAA